MAISEVQTRLTGGGVYLSWVDSNPDSYTITVTEIDYTDPGTTSTRTVSVTTPDTLVLFDEDVDPATDEVTYLITNDDDAATGTVTTLLSGGWTYGAPDHDASTIRYTTLAAVKLSLGVPTLDTQRDTEITSAILTAESWIDEYCGRSFADTSANPELSAIPNRVKRAALLLATSFYTSAMSPDAMDPFESELRTERASNMAVQLLSGFRVTWGVA